MNDRAPAVRPDLTPNQLDKRRQIVDAARQVLATQGLAGCTAREVAAASPLTKSGIHYYFADMDVLIDQAMDGHVAAFEAQLRAAGTSEPDAIRAFWATVDAYLGLFRERPSVTQLWFEYWIAGSRKGRLDPISHMHHRLAALFSELLEAVGVVAPGPKGRAVLVYLMGAIVDQTVEPQTAQRIRADLAALVGCEQLQPDTPSIERSSGRGGLDRGTATARGPATRRAHP